MKTNKKSLLLFTALFLSVIGVTGAYMLISGSSQESLSAFSSAQKEHSAGSSISPVVKNAYTDTPIENAVVYVYGATLSAMRVLTIQSKKTGRKQRSPFMPTDTFPIFCLAAPSMNTKNAAAPKYCWYPAPIPLRIHPSSRWKLPRAAG